MRSSGFSTASSFFGLLLLRDRFDIVGLQPLQLLALCLIESLVPHDHIIELLPCDNHVVELLEGLVFLVHHAKHEEPIALDLLYEVSIEGKGLELGHVLQFLDLFKVREVVSVEVEGLELREGLDLFLDVLEIVVGEIEPFEV